MLYISENERRERDRCAKCRSQIEAEAIKKFIEQMFTDKPNHWNETCQLCVGALKQQWASKETKCRGCPILGICSIFIKHMSNECKEKLEDYGEI